jgi:mutator protein MutT
MPQTVDKRKAGGILITDKKVLVLRDTGEDTFMTPGGTVDQGETPEHTLIRELQEEISITVKSEDLQLFGVFMHPMATDTTKMLEMTVYVVNKWSGDIKLQHEIEEQKWIDSKTAQETKLGSIFAEEIIPRLVQQGLIT